MADEAARGRTAVAKVRFSKVSDGTSAELRADRFAGVKATASRRPAAGPDGLAIDSRGSIR
jgi:hypothetical protein